MRKDTAVPQGELESARLAAERINNNLDGRKPTYYIETYGCQMNEHDSEKIAGILERCGYVPAADKAAANIIFFNTCCVRDHAEKKVFGNIGALKKVKDENPSLIIGVCGCMMQQKEVADKLFKRFPYLDMVFGTNELHMLPNLLEKVLNGERIELVRQMDGEIAEGLPVKRIDSVSQFVTIMYGCNNFCSYCIVPYVRGRERSRSVESIVNEVKDLAANGVKEITLLGQNVNSYYSEDDNADFPALLRAVCKVDGIERVRFMTSHPKDLSDGLIAAMAEEEKVCPHIHLPVQSGSDRILKLMNRHYDRERYFTVVDKLKAAVPGVELTTDIIVGFPGETEEDFEATLDMVEKIGYSAAYTFKYSPRTGTKAATMDEQISEEVKKERLKRLNDTVAKGLKAGSKKYIGQEGEVLVEGCDHRGEPMAYGKLPCFKMVYFKGDESMIGSLRRVRITEITKNSLVGELI